MTVVAEITETQTTEELSAVGRAPLWGTFESVRTHLFDQFQDVPYVPDTGLPLEELQREIEVYLDTHPEQPRVLQKAHIFRIVVTRGRIYVDPTDWFVDKLDHGNFVKKVRDGWLEEAKTKAREEEDDWNDRMLRLGVMRAYYLDLGHISPGWEKMLSRGLVGLLEDVAERRAQLSEHATDEQLAFYEAVEIVYGATLKLASRFADLARKLISEYPEHEDRLLAIARTCERVPAHRPRTLHEAFQFAWLMHQLIEMDGQWVRSMGQFDRTFLPYYRADIESGRLTPEQAKELIKFFWIGYHAHTRGRDNGKNFVFAGLYPNGEEITNELTYLALEAYEELNTPDPKLSVRFRRETPNKLYRRVADLIRRGHNSFVLMNDEVAVDALVKRGKPLEDARYYLPIGCYEPAIEGKEVGCTMNLVVNLAKGVELALHDGMDPLSGEQVGPHTGDSRGFAGFEDLFNAYTKQMDFILTHATDLMRDHELTWPEVNPSPLIAATIDDCIARGKDIGQGGAHYNSVGCTGVALANTADSLMAIKQTVFDEQRFTMGEMVEALEHDFEGREPMRQYLLNRVPKWGNDDPEVDGIARRVADYYCDKIHTFKNGRGGDCQASLFTLTFQWSMGRATGALPEGRKAHEALAPGVGPATGRDKSGVTAAIGSVTKLDFVDTPNGSVLDVMLHPSAVQGEAGLNAFVTLIMTFFTRGGYAIQFNVFDTDTLRDAQLHPERYSTLQIRVTGWSVYFTTLSKFEQDQFITRNAHIV